MDCRNVCANEQTTHLEAHVIYFDLLVFTRTLKFYEEELMALLDKLSLDEKRNEWLQVNLKISRTAEEKLQKPQLELIILLKTLSFQLNLSVIIISFISQKFEDFKE